MTTELIAMLGGGASGFIFKLIGQLVSNQQSTVDAMIKKQAAADESHQKASTRGGEWVRRHLTSLDYSRESSIGHLTDILYYQRFVKQF